MQSTGGILTRRNGATIAYRQCAGTKPGIVFIHGLRSDMNGTKALALEEYCRAEGRAFLRFDLSGHGESSGRFEEGCIGQWKDDVIEVIDRLTEGPQILVGSSLGGWLMLLAALARPERVTALLGLAAAPDFTEDLMAHAFDAEQRRILVEDGSVTIEDCHGGEPYAITRRLIVEGRDHLLLRKEIAIDCPVALLQGQQDGDVPWQTALTLASRLRSPDVVVALVKTAGHRLSEPGQIAMMTNLLRQLVSR
jgi:pimeloyl-ACP methyl ester carboxylesterase